MTCRIVTGGRHVFVVGGTRTVSHSACTAQCRCAARRCVIAWSALPRVVSARARSTCAVAHVSSAAMHCSRYSFASACSPFSRNTRPSTPYARARISCDAVPERSSDTFKSLLASCALCAGRCRCPGGVARRSEYIFRSSLRGSSTSKECCICLTSATSASIASRGTGGYCTPILVRNVRTRQLFAADCYVLSITAVESRVRIV
jgi:hypothetical protein